MALAASLHVVWWKRGTEYWLRSGQLSEGIGQIRGEINGLPLILYIT